MPIWSPAIRSTSGCGKGSKPSAARAIAEAPAIVASLNAKLDLMRRRSMLDGSYVEEFPDEDDQAFLAANDLPINATD